MSIPDGRIDIASRLTSCYVRVSMILVKDSAPDPSSLGITNGLAQFAMVRPSPLVFPQW